VISAKLKKNTTFYTYDLTCLLHVTRISNNPVGQSVQVC